MIRHVESSEIILYLAEKENLTRPLGKRGNPISVHIKDVYQYGRAMERRDPAVRVVVGESAYRAFQTSFPGVVIKARTIQIKDITSPKVEKAILRCGPTASTREILGNVRFSKKK